MDPTYPLYPIVSFVCFILLLVPLPLHLHLKNAGTSMYIIWTATSCFILFINSIVWHNNAIDKAPVWCDISGGILLGNSIAIPACVLCIQRRLYLATQIVLTSRKEKMKYIVQDLVISLGFPLFVMALAYTVQGNRYDVFEEFGCYIPIYNVWPAYPIFFLPPLAIGLVSLCYSLLTLRAFASRRSELNEFLNSGTVDFKRHVRLMCLASVDIAFTIPFCVWGIQSNISDMHPYISWEDTHFGFSIIRTYPDIIWRGSEKLRILVEFCRWIVILCAVVFIAFFTFAEECRRKYSVMFGAVGTRLGWSRLIKTKRKGRHHTLPPMFPTDRTRDGTFVSSINDDVVDDMAERERVVASGLSFVSVSTMVFSDSQVEAHVAPNSAMNVSICTPPLPAKLERIRCNNTNAV